ncbi:hypothetical protein AUJ17_01320 [Candidatus Micrarchaeota archaeon CG1_02_47_40]|nr:MAG: hypothetical protein AUJ17_01320 [Candidatus Micrarchaeota archaeon CG1_02_47_40]
MSMISTKQMGYGSAVIGLLGVVGSFAGGGGIFSLIGGIVAGLGAVLAIGFYKYGYVLFPFLTTGAKIVQVTDTGYEIPPEQNAILKRVGSSYYASMFLGVRIYESTTDKTPQENIIYSEYFERAISSVRFVTKFAMLVYVKDITDFRDKMETKHAEAQLRLSRERDKSEPDVLKIDRYEREVSMWENQISKLTKGIKPMGSIAYIMTTATGSTKEAALAAAKSQANEVRATVANALNVDVVPLTGEEMKLCFDWEHTIPPTQREIESQLE